MKTIISKSFYQTTIVFWPGTFLYQLGELGTIVSIDEGLFSPTAKQPKIRIPAA